MSKAVKTNAMRMLDRAKIPYRAIEYEIEKDEISGVRIADITGFPYESVFKTLVAKGDKTGPIVMCIPVDREIDLKAAAKASGNKKLEMVHVKDLFGLTGYIRGGCSPVGMKKNFPTFFDEACLKCEDLAISAGICGCQLIVSREALVDFTQAVVCHLCREN